MVVVVVEEEVGLAQLVSLREEVGAFLGSWVLIHAFGIVVEKEEHPWHHLVVYGGGYSLPGSVLA